jgi:hypothetical protein
MRKVQKPSNFEDNWKRLKITFYAHEINIFCEILGSHRSEYQIFDRLRRDAVYFGTYVSNYVSSYPRANWMRFT